MNDKYKRKTKIVFGDINDEIFIDNLIKNNDVIINLAAYDRNTLLICGAKQLFQNKYFRFSKYFKFKLKI